MGLGKDIFVSTLASSNPYMNYLNAQAGAPIWAMPGKAFNAARNASNFIGNSASNIKQGINNFMSNRKNSPVGGESEDPQQPNNQNNTNGNGAIDNKIGQQIIRTLETGFKSLEQNFQKASNFLEENSKENQDLKNKLDSIAQKQDVQNKLLEAQANHANKAQARMSHPLSKNITTMTTILERIAKATEDSAKIAKLTVGLGMNSNVKASAVMNASSYIDPSDNTSGKKKHWYNDMKRMQKDVSTVSKQIKESNDIIVDKLEKVNATITENLANKSNGNSIFKMLKGGLITAGMLGLKGSILAGKASWKHIINPAIDYNVTRFKVGANAKKESLEAEALKEYTEALKSGDSSRIAKAKVVLKKRKISDMMANFAAQNEGATGGLELFLKKHNERNKSVPFDTQTRDAIITGIPMLLSEILKAISGQDKQWNYEYGRLSSTDEVIKAKTTSAKYEHIKAAEELKSNKGLLWYGKNTGEKVAKVNETRKNVDLATSAAKNQFGINGGLDFSAATKTIDKDYAQGGIHTHNQMFESIKNNQANLVKAANATFKGIAKVAIKFVIKPIAKAMLRSLCESLDATEGGRNIFTKYIKPNLPKLLDHCNSYQDLFYSIETAFPYILNSIKTFLNDVEDGKVGIFEPMAIAIRGFLTAGDDKGNTVNSQIIAALMELKNIVKGTIFENTVNSAIDYIIHKAIPILLGNNLEANKKFKSFNDFTKKITGAKYTEINSKDVFSQLASGNPTEMKRLLIQAGLSESAADKALGNIDELKVNDVKPLNENLINSIKNVSNNQSGVNTNINASVDTTKIETSLDEILKMMKSMNINIDTTKIETSLDEIVNTTKSMNVNIDTTKIETKLNEIYAINRSSNQSIDFIIKYTRNIDEQLNKLINKETIVDVNVVSMPKASITANITDDVLSALDNYYSRNDYWDSFCKSSKDSIIYGLVTYFDNNEILTRVKNDKNDAVPVKPLGSINSKTPRVSSHSIPKISVKQKTTWGRMIVDGIVWGLKKIGAGGKILGKFLGNLTIEALKHLGKYIAKGTGWLLKKIGKLTLEGLKKLGTHFIKNWKSYIITPIKFIGKGLWYSGKGIYAASKFMVKNISSISTAIGKVGSALWKTVKFLGKTLKVGYDFGKGLFGILLNPIGWLKDKLVGLLGFLKSAVKGVFKGIGSLFGFGKKGKEATNNRYLRLITAYTRGTYDNLSILLKSKGLTPAKLKLPASTGFLGAIGSVAKGTGKAVAAVAMSPFTVAKGATTFFANSVTKVKEKMKEKRENKNSQALQSISKNTNKLNNQFGKYWAWQKTKNFFSMLGGILQTGFTTLTSLLSGVFSAISSLAGSLFPGIGKTLGKVASPLLKGTINTFKSVGGSLGSFLGSGSKIGSIIGMGSKLIAPLGLAYAAYQGLDGAISGHKNADKTFNLKEGQEATFVEKISSGVGGGLGSIIGGTLDLFGGKHLANLFGYESMTEASTKAFSNVAKTSTNIASGLTSIVGGLFTGNASRNAVIWDLVRTGVIEANALKITRINDYEKFKNLSIKNLKDMLDYGFANPQEENLAISILTEKEAKQNETQTKEVKINNSPQDKITNPIDSNIEKSSGFDTVTDLAILAGKTMLGYIINESYSQMYSLRNDPNTGNGLYHLSDFSIGSMNTLGLSKYDRTSKEHQINQKIKEMKSHEKSIEQIRNEYNEVINQQNILTERQNRAQIQQVSLKGNIAIAEAPSVFTNMLTVLKQIENNTRVSKINNRDSYVSNNNNSNANNDIISSSSAGNTPPVLPNGAETELNKAINSSNAMMNQARANADIQKKVEDATRQANATNISQATLYAGRS